jgi:hypothetical protein
MKKAGVIIYAFLGLMTEDAVASLILFLIINFLIGVSLPFIKIWGSVLTVHICLNLLKAKGFLR